MKMEFLPAHTVVIERVIDGDTVELSESLYDVTRLRVDGIDTPETRTAYCRKERDRGYEAKGFAVATLEGKTVIVYSDGKKGRYGRLIARIEIDGQDYSQMMVNRGYAVRYTASWRKTPKEKRWC